MSFSTYESWLLMGVGLISILAVLAWVAHYISYQIIKRKTLHERRWDYNICCGTTDGGGINADIVQHSIVPRFELISDVTKLPHTDQEFDHILCSHTIEHVPDPSAMYRELRRIGKSVTILVPPLWDFTAALNPFEHQVIFLTLHSRHENHLPPYIRFAPARWLQAIAGQKINADAFCVPGNRRMQELADRCMPFLFLIAGLSGMLQNRAGWVFFPLGLLALWLSKRPGS